MQLGRQSLESTESKMVFRMFRSSIVSILFLAVAALIVGCDDRPKRVPVAGQVLIDGKPLELGTVRLVPQGARPSVGQIGEDGRFVLNCYEGDDGVIPGTHRVAVIANKGKGDTALEWFAPKKYADFRKSGLEVTIDEKQEDLKIELTWDGGKPFVEGTVAKGDFVEE